MRVTPVHGIKVTLSILAISLAMAPALAKNKKDTEVKIEPCPVDTIIRTADPKLLEKYSVLQGCRDQVLVAPADASEYTQASDVIIVPENKERSTYAIDQGTDFDMQYADAVKKQAKKNRRAAKDGNGAVWQYGDGNSTVSLAGTGSAIRIVPEKNEMAYDSASAALPAASMPTDAAAGQNGSAILAMRPQSYRTQYDSLISEVANRHKIDPLLLHAVIKQESGYRNTAASHVGARGLMQIMPATGRSLGVDPSNLHNAELNVDAGARLLRKLYYRYNGDFQLVLAAYNAGEGAVQKYGNKVPPYRETQNYVRVVMAHYYKLLGEQNNGATPR
jgi:soluble lytic murein transglycosylase-like protein